MNLSDYVKKRNGVPMGEANSLRNMMNRSLGSGKFSRFWNYWNPIWGYYLGKHIYKPLKGIFPSALSLILTFGFCGFLHDLVIMMIRWNYSFLFTPWFLIMGFWVVITEFLNIDYSKYTWVIRALINLAFICSSLLIAYQIRI
ncbi:hypothetical protein WJN01_10355 [Flavobacteriaceae bacterium SZ-1-7]|uniref:hypothetical protein n=1 Tax=Tamlana sedimenti TaxID=3134126 RepID=UPI0031206D98